MVSGGLNLGKKINLIEEFIILFLPFLGFYYKFKENLENKFNI